MVTSPSTVQSRVDKQGLLGNLKALSENSSR